MSDRPVALVTGASTGIGLAVSLRLMREGYFVVLTARGSSLERLQKGAHFEDPSRYWLRPLDVRDPLERRELIEEVEKELGRIDVLVNNAGVIYRTPIEYAYEFESKEQMLANFHAPMEMAKICLPLLRRHRGGRIIMISSAAGFLAMPTMGLYAASKHALEGASEALYYELKPWDIHVTLIEPGFVAGPAYLNTRLGLAFDRATDTTAASYWLQSRVINALIQRAIQMTTSTPSEVAESIVEVLRRRKPPLRRAVTLDAQVFAFLKRFLPAGLFDHLISYCLGQIRRQVEQSEFECPSPAEL